MDEKAKGVGFSPGVKNSKAPTKGEKEGDEFIDDQLKTLFFEMSIPRLKEIDTK